MRLFNNHAAPDARHGFCRAFWSAAGLRPGADGRQAGQRVHQEQEVAREGKAAHGLRPHQSVQRPFEELCRDELVESAHDNADLQASRIEIPFNRFGHET